MNRISRTIAALLFSFCFTIYSYATDPFANYLKSTAKVVKILSDSTAGTGENAITIRKLTFSSRDGQNTIFAIMAFPQREGKFPSLMVLHGGGGTAMTMAKNVIEYAKRGYVTLSPDEPGIGNSEKMINSSGPWKTRSVADTRFDFTNGASSSILVDGIVADLEIFNYLSVQPNVDANAMGITGTSWGGYATTILAGLLKERVKAAYSVYGSGFYEKGSNWVGDLEKLSPENRQTWLTNLDAGRRAKDIKAPYFVEAPTNDTFFWPEAVTATLEEIKGTKNHTWTANANHKRVPSGADMQKTYFDYYLKGLGKPFGAIETLSIIDKADLSKLITAKINLPGGIKTDSVKLFYSEKGEKWQKRIWKFINATLINEATYQVILPADLVQKNVDFYIWAMDSRKLVFSSLMYDSKGKRF